MSGRMICRVLLSVFASIVALPSAENADQDTVGFKIKVNPKDNLQYVWVPPGSYWMGCSLDDDQCDAIEAPRHKVTITKGFWMGRVEVPFQSYQRFAKSTRRKMPPPPSATPFGELTKKKPRGWSRAIANAFTSGPGKKEDRPIVAVTFADAGAYCEFAGGRLPTEAEWEYAARGGKDGLLYPWGNELSHDHANYGNVAGRDQWRYAAPGGSFDPNPWGLYDMAGNVWEWCSDWADGNYYLKSPKKDPPGPPSGDARIIRGGSWGFGPRYLRVSARAMADPGSRGDGVGFRCVVPDLP